MLVPRSLFLGSLAALAVLWTARAAPVPAAPLIPRAPIGHYNGNAGVNTPLWNVTNGDVPAVFVGAAPPPAVAFGPLVGNADNAKTVAGQSWGPLLDIGTCAVGAGIAVIRLRVAPFNGPSLVLPGGCPGEILHTGTLLGLINAPHAGVTCNVPNQLIPTSAVGSTWAAQAAVRAPAPGGVELSSVLYGVVDVCF